MIARVLTPRGYIINLANDWQEAWDFGAAEFLRFCHSKFGLPAVNGMQLFEDIREYNSNLSARRIFITRYLLNPELEATLIDTRVPYLTKPFALSQIRSLVLEKRDSGVLPTE